MVQVPTTALKEQLSKYLRLARDGEKVVVMERGRPIAVLAGLEEERSGEDQVDVREAWNLVDAGVANWKGGKPRGSDRPVKVRGKTVAEMVIEDRR
jgi:prevent-host-death family protein